MASWLDRVPPVRPARSAALARASATATPAVSGRVRVAIIGGSHGGLACACSLIAAGLDPSALAVFERSSEGRGGGAGVVTDDLSVGFLKGMGALSDDASKQRVHPMRVQEERVGCSGHRLAREDNFPCFSAYWADVHAALKERLPAGLVRWEKELRSYTQQPAGEGGGGGAVLLEFADGETLSCELLIGADGPTSGVRSKAEPPPAGWHGGLRYAGYHAWRGVLPRSACPEAAFQQLKQEYTDYGNCLYFITSNADAGRRQHAVLYELGGELINWLIYVVSEEPVCGGKATMAPPAAMLAALHAEVEEVYGAALAQIVRATPGPWIDCPAPPCPALPCLAVMSCGVFNTK
jgi:2-polyprenyl-6-methoxyphenol hydroxylase-like FAD-dependent oxidoreductase